MSPERLEQLRPVIGTLAHNRSFTLVDLEDYCYWRTPRIPVSSGTIAALVRSGLLEPAGAERVRGQHPRRLYRPTRDGWSWIEGRPA